MWAQQQNNATGGIIRPWRVPGYEPLRYRRAREAMEAQHVAACERIRALCIVAAIEAVSPIRVEVR